MRLLYRAVALAAACGVSALAAAAASSNLSCEEIRINQAKAARIFLDSLSDEQLAKMCVPAAHSDNVAGTGLRTDLDLVSSERSPYDSLVRITNAYYLEKTPGALTSSEATQQLSLFPVQAYLELAASFSVNDRKGGSGWVPVFDYGSGAAEPTPNVEAPTSRNSVDFSQMYTSTSSAAQKRDESLLNSTAARLRRHTIPANSLFPEAAFAHRVEVRFSRLSAAQQALIRAAASRHSDVRGIDWAHAVVTFRHTLSFNGWYAEQRQPPYTNGPAYDGFQYQIL